MDINTQIRESLRLLTGIKEGILPSSDCYSIISKLDCVLTSITIRYLRKKYPPTNPASSGVIGRLVDLTGTYPDVVKVVKDGEADSISEWFDETYSFRDFYDNPEELITMIVEKLEG
ncbi:MAG: hypothetical protein HRU19_12020 [Pseudobacteriovorax sp.]|nr:hypothetical protein [Pseudobacteriovorax sp.]